MAITFVADAYADATNVALPAGWSAGDVAVVFSYRSNSTGPPSLPSGWTNVVSSNGVDGNSRRIGYRKLVGGDTTTGTWTNATSIAVIILTGQNSANPIGAIASGGSHTSTMTTPALTLLHQDGTSWVLAFAGSKATDANAKTLSGTTDEGSTSGHINAATGRDISTWSSGNYSATVNAIDNRTDVVEIKVAGPWARVTTMAEEVLYQGDPKARVTTIAEEVLYSEFVSGVDGYIQIIDA